MRLLKLRWKNINSFAGEFSIDFRDPAYRQSGIFAIVGPTGSGKTSILDALALALYGTTPRTEAGKGAEKCMVMTKGRTECYAAVVFEVRGVTYLSRWSQRLARKSLNLQPEQVELVRLANPDDTAGEILAEKKTEWRNAIDRVTGLTFETFTKSVMLAQGAFASLLRAKEDERAAILEQITGTSLYSDIGRAVFEREREERRKLAALEAELEHALPMSDEARAVLDSEHAQAVKDVTEHEARRVVLEKTKALWEARTQAEVELKAREAQTERAEEESRRAAEDEAKLQAARRALAPAEGLAALERDRRGAEALERDLEKARANATSARERAHAADAARSTARSAREAAERSEAEFQPVFEALLRADTEIAQLTEALERETKEACSARENLIASEVRVKAARATFEEASRAGVKAEEVLRSDPDAEAIRSGLSAVKLAVERHRTAALRRMAVAKKTEALATEIAEDKRLEAERRHTLEALAQKTALVAGAKEKAERDLEIASAGKGLEQSLLEMRRAAEARLCAEWATSIDDETVRGRAVLENADGLTDTVRDYLEGLFRRFGEVRARLEGTWPEAFEDGRPLEAERLEGSIATLRAWSSTAGAAQRKADEVRRALTLAERAEREARDEADAARRRAEGRALERQTLLGELAGAESALEAARADYLQSVSSWISEERLAKAPKPAVILKELEERAARREDALRARDAALEAARRAESAVALEAAKCEEARTRAENARVVLEAREKTLGEAREQRTRTWGTIDPKAENAARRAALASARTCEEAAETESRRAAKTLAEALEAEKSLEVRRSAATKELADAEKAFGEKLHAAGFESENELRAACLSGSEIERLERAVHERAEALSAARTALSIARKNDEAARGALEALFASLEEAGSGDARLDAAHTEAALSAVLSAVARLRETLGSLAEKRRADDERRRTSAEMRKAIEAQRLRGAEWAKLVALIGDAEGKRFRKAAQKLTFAMLLQNANVMLEHMHSRYRLEPAGASQLDVAVRDEDLAGVVRTSANLSGGETFLVSLALALALSRISTKNLRVDTLFLDEGFGSLDAVTLEKALSALETLQRTSQKLIGLISHVKAVSDRIPAHVTVRPRGATGESIVTGPGVERIA